MQADVDVKPNPEEVAAVKHVDLQVCRTGRVVKSLYSWVVGFALQQMPAAAAAACRSSSSTEACRFADKQQQEQ